MVTWLVWVEGGELGLLERFRLRRLGGRFGRELILLSARVLAWFG